MKWLDESPGGGKPETKKRMDPLPRGPYLYVRQGDEIEFQKTLSPRLYEMSYEFNQRWGFSIWVCDLQGQPQLIAYHYDTSD